MERSLYREQADPQRGLTGFFHAGTANPDINPFRYALAFGVVYQGLFRSRPDDILGVGVAPARFSSKWQQLSRFKRRRALGGGL